ncbi:thioredoxin domain-containing protein, partial [Streptococcus pyogenes]
PACSKCKKLRVLLASQDIDVDWINYLEIPLRTEELLKLLEKMQVKPSQVIRMSEEERLSLSEEEVFDLLVAQPELL